MKWFQRTVGPDEAGARLYEALRMAIAGPAGDLSIAAFLGRLGVPAERLSEQYAGELMVGAMFGARLAVERSVPRVLGGELLRGMCAEFLRHLAEQGARPEQVDEWERVYVARSGEYRRALEGYDGLEPPWRLGRRFLWAITGVEEYAALPVKHATFYLLAARDLAQELLNALGPHLRLDPST